LGRGKGVVDLLRTIAHEFAHVRLFLKYPEPKDREKARNCENNPEHDEKNDEFYEYLIKNLEKEEKELIQSQG